MSGIKLPKFESESEEAQWWFDHREEVGAELVKAMEEGRLGEGTRARMTRRMNEALQKTSAA